MSEPKGTLRKAAILISSLDTRSADRLLDQMGPQQAAKVRDAVMELRDIDPVEQEAVIQEFLGRPAALNQASESGVELDQSLASKINSKAGYTSHRMETDFALDPVFKRAADVAPTPPAFHSFLNASAEKLAHYLEQEHPQVIAVVLVHLPPERAAEVLGHLPTTLRSEVIQRVANVDETNPDVLRDIEHALDSRVNRERISAQKPTLGLAAAQAILAAAKAGTRQEIVAQLVHTQRDLAAKLGIKNELPPPPKSIGEEPRSKDNNSPANEMYFAEPTRNDASTRKTTEPPRRQHQGVVESGEPALSSLSAGPKLDFQDVERLENRELAFVLKSVDPQVALLALTGADQRLIDRILKQLPTRDARALRGKLRTLGPLRLSDVQEAQQEFARAASRLIAKGLVQNPLTKRATVAA